MYSFYAIKGFAVTSPKLGTVLQKLLPRLYKWLNKKCSVQQIAKKKKGPLIWCRQNRIKFVIKHLLQLLQICTVVWAPMKQRFISWLSEGRRRWVCLLSLPPPVCIPAVISAGLCINDPTSNLACLIWRAPEAYPNFYLLSQGIPDIFTKQLFYIVSL